MGQVAQLEHVTAVFLLASFHIVPSDSSIHLVFWHLSWNNFGGGLWIAGGVIRYICALHYGKRRGWEKCLECAKIYSFGCSGAKVAVCMAAVVDGKLLHNENRFTQFSVECIWSTGEILDKVQTQGTISSPLQEEKDSRQRDRGGVMRSFIYSWGSLWYLFVSRLYLLLSSMYPCIVPVHPCGYVCLSEMKCFSLRLLFRLSNCSMLQPNCDWFTFLSRISGWLQLHSLHFCFPLEERWSMCSRTNALSLSTFEIGWMKTVIVGLRLFPVWVSSDIK